MSYVPFLLPLNSNYRLHPVNFCEHNPHSRHNKCLLAFILPSFIRYHPVMKRSSDAGVSHWGKCHNFEWNVNIPPHICRVTTTNIDVLEFVSPSFSVRYGAEVFDMFFSPLKIHCSWHLSCLFCSSLLLCAACAHLWFCMCPNCFGRRHESFGICPASTICIHYLKTHDTDLTTLATMKGVTDSGTVHCEGRVKVSPGPHSLLVLLLKVKPQTVYGR